MSEMLKRTIKRYINLTNYREKFWEGSEPYDNATEEMKRLEGVILKTINEEDN